jgi:tellurite resistance protein TerA
MSNEKLSQDSMAEATRYRAKYSGHGKSKGAAGYKVEGNDPDSEFLSSAGQTITINPRDNGFGQIHIGAAWENVIIENSSGFFSKLLKKATRQGIDIDLGCLYELQDESRGCIQAFGDKMGSYDKPPFISLSGDERTGDAKGDDEFLRLNGAQWSKIKRILVYTYIYNDVANWSDIRPQIQVSIPGEHPMVVIPDAKNSQLSVCAIAMIENIRNGICITNHSEYFPGHAEMDRAFGFGIEWSDGQKTA